MAGAAGRRLIICGPPNVGKSLIFNRLTGRYATVSNYPGTTVEISAGQSPLLEGCEVVDTPGAYSLLAVSEEERVTREVLLAASDDSLLLHVVDAKNLRRMLPMTLELLALGARVVLILNLSDEADRLGVVIDEQRLGSLLGIPVVKSVATRADGISELVHLLRDGVPAKSDPSDQPELSDQGDAGEGELNRRRRLQSIADSMLEECAVFPAPTHSAAAGLLSRLTLNFWTAIPLAVLVIYLGVYKFVGGFGAGTLVDFLENGIYERFITPSLTRWTEKLVSATWLQDLFVHEYGMLTLGLRYAIALILPIVGTFFLLFSVLEDSGYLPRLAYLLDRLFKRIGLNGRAVIPIVLGFGCGTMATMVTRILETKRERIIATLLLGVAIPCSAQLGVILAMLAGHPAAFAAWCIVLSVIFLGLGFLAANKLPGEVPSFYLELPPLRVPRAGNVIMKTYSRMHWYFLEILPLFLIASVLIWVGNITHTFKAVTSAIAPVVKAMGLPADAASALLFGFFRRDYGAAGLFELQRSGAMNARQSFVSVLVITLFLPCIAQFFMMKKERGWLFAVGTSASILVLATTAGLVANFVLVHTGWI